MLRDPALNELQLYVWPAPRMDTSGSYLCAKERVAWISSKQSFDALCTSGVDSQPSSKSISHFGREPERSVVILSKFITSCPISRCAMQRMYHRWRRQNKTSICEPNNLVIQEKIFSFKLYKSCQICSRSSLQVMSDIMF